MAHPSGLHQSATLSGCEVPYAPLRRSSSALTRAHPQRIDPPHLAPEHAFVTSPLRRTSGYAGHGRINEIISESDSQSQGRRYKETSRSRSRRPRKRFQKLLWVKQSYPDNYTDQATFLENLQRNPRLQPYDFWPLVADSTVIVQHVCSVIMFVVCFALIFHQRVRAMYVSGSGSFATFVGWLMWDWWVSQEGDDGAAAGGLARARSIGLGRTYGGDAGAFRPSRCVASRLGTINAANAYANASSTTLSTVSSMPSAASSTTDLAAVHSLEKLQQHPSLVGGANSNSKLLQPNHIHSLSTGSLHPDASNANAAGSTISRSSSPCPASTWPTPSQADGDPTRPEPKPGSRGSRVALRMGAVKSAVLIYFTLLGLSPILKSLTRSTSSDSIWAMSFWLLAINIFFFDYRGDAPSNAANYLVGGGRFPAASLSTNAALMASTVLASRLPSTGQVFSLTLFSIQVFGLFPVFRRYARHQSRRFHVALTVILVLGAGGGVGLILGWSEGGAWPWGAGIWGMVVGCLIAALAMGGCSWWLIGLQKYKNEIYGPWDPARPVIYSRRGWDDG